MEPSCSQDLSTPPTFPKNLRKTCSNPLDEDAAQPRRVLWLRLPPGKELRPGSCWRDEADLEVAPARVRDAEPHHDVLQVEHVLVAMLGAGAAEGAGKQHVVRPDVPAGDGQSIASGMFPECAPQFPAAWTPSYI